MSNIALLLGPVLFQGFEVPERIGFGGRQRMAVHDLPGGARVIDALGRDDTPVVFGGVLSGPDASLRAHEIDLLRAQGAPLPLTWDSYFYTVVIADFRATYTRANWIPYRIVCTVLRDEAEALVQTGLTLLTQSTADLGSAASLLGGSVDLTGANAALAAPGATTLGTGAYSAAQSALAGTQSAVSGAITTAEGTLGPIAAGGFAGGDAAGGIAALGGATGAAGQLAALSAAQGYLGRTATNLANASP